MMVVLIVTKVDGNLVNIEGLDKLNGDLKEECEYTELKRKLGFIDTDLPDQHCYRNTRKVTDLLSILTDHHFLIVSQCGSDGGLFVSWTLTRRFCIHMHN